MIRISTYLTIALVALLCGACDNDMPVATEASAHTADGEAHSQKKATPSDDDPEAAPHGGTAEATDHSAERQNPENADFYPLSEEETVGQNTDNSEENEESGDSETALNGVANLNEASLEKLQLLPGIGPAIASRIEKYREKRSFEKPDDIMRVRGIGDATFEKLRDHLSVEGPTTLGK